MKKVHIGNGGTAFCARGIYLNRSTRLRPSLTKPREEFLKLPREMQCERCLKNSAPPPATDTSDFAAGLSRHLGLNT